MLSASLSRRSAFVRFTGYAVALFAAMLKFYPITLMILAVRERLAVFIAAGLASVGVIALWFWLDRIDILRSMANIPSTQNHFDYNVFSARNLPYGLAEIFGLPPQAGTALLAALLAGMVATAMRLVWAGNVTKRLRWLSEAETTLLLIGCSVMLGCFILAQNVRYRGIYFLFILPGLTALVRGDDRRIDPLWFKAAAAILLLMWSAPLQPLIGAVPDLSARSPQLKVLMNFSLWLVCEMLWWAVCAAMAALLAGLLLNAQSTHDAIRLLNGGALMDGTGRPARRPKLADP